MVKKTLRAIECTRPSSENCTPASLLLEYAKRSESCGYRYDKYGRIHLLIEGRDYIYDSWEIRPLVGNKNIDLITIYLEEEVQ